MKAVRIAAFATVVIFVLAVIVAAAAAFRAPAPGEYAQDSFYVVFSLRTLVLGFVLPVIVLAAILIATYLRRPGGVAGLWLGLVGAVMMTAPSVFFYMASDLGAHFMPRRYADDIDSAGRWLVQGSIVMSWVALAGMACVVIGAILWAVARRRTPRDETAELFR